MLRAENAELKKRIAELERKSNSRNSSLPPSKDITKASRNRSLRKSSGQKSDGQKGHKGSHLKMTDEPDFIVDHKLKECLNCKSILVNSEHTLCGQKKLFDLPPVKIEVTEHRQYQAICPCCHHSNTSLLPNIFGKPRTCYGPVLGQLVKRANISSR